MTQTTTRTRKRAPKHTPAPDASKITSAMHWRDETNAVGRLSIERARALVFVLLAHDHDEEARALMELVTGIAYEPDSTRRDSLGLWVVHQAYTTTSEFSEAANRFATEAAQRAQV